MRWGASDRGEVFFCSFIYNLMLQGILHTYAVQKKLIWNSWRFFFWWKFQHTKAQITHFALSTQTLFFIHTHTRYSNIYIYICEKLLVMSSARATCKDVAFRKFIALTFFCWRMCRVGGKYTFSYTRVHTHWINAKNNQRKYRHLPQTINSICMYVYGAEKNVRQPFSRLKLNFHFVFGASRAENFYWIITLASALQFIYLLAGWHWWRKQTTQKKNTLKSVATLKFLFFCSILCTHVQPKILFV